MGDWPARDGSAGVSPEGWLPDRVSVGALTRAFPPDLVDRVVATTRPPRAAASIAAGPAGGVLRAGVVAVSGPELRLRAGHGQVGGRAVSPPPRPASCWSIDPDGWVDAGAGRRWRPPNMSGLARAAGWGPIRCTCCSTRSPGPVGAPDAAGVFCGCGWCPWTAPPLTCPTRRRTTSTSGGRRMPPEPGRSRRSGGWPRRSRAPGR